MSPRSTIPGGLTHRRFVLQKGTNQARCIAHLRRRSQGLSASNVDAEVPQRNHLARRPVPLRGGGSLRLRDSLGSCNGIVFYEPRIDSEKSLEVPQGDHRHLQATSCNLVHTSFLDLKLGGDKKLTTREWGRRLSNSDSGERPSGPFFDPRAVTMMQLMRTSSWRVAEMHLAELGSKYTCRGLRQIILYVLPCH
jgi:hypothetical protein